MNTILGKHRHYFLVLLGLLILLVMVSHYLALVFKSVLLPMIGFGLIVVAGEWIRFGINRKTIPKNENEPTQEFVSTPITPNPSDSLLESKEKLLQKYSYKYWFLFLGAIFLVLTMLQSKKRITLEDIRNGVERDHPIFRLSGDYLLFFSIYIFCVALYFAFLKYKKAELESTFLFVVIGVVFNPFFPFHFGKDLQIIIGILTILFFVFMGYREYSSNTVSTKSSRLS